jgi:predicted benzoate:H+ symporter BenE
MRRRARLLLRIGFAVFVAGLAVFVVGFASFAAPIVECIENPSAADCAQPEASGWLVSLAGTVIGMVGMIIIIVSVFMRRRARREEERL